MARGTVLFVVAHEGYQPIEYAEPKKVLEDAGFTIITASNKPGVATDKDGGTTPVDSTLDAINPTDYDGVFFIGGPGALEHLDTPQSYTLIAKALAHHIPLGAICISTRILAKAGALTRKRATGWNRDNELGALYETHGATYVPDPVVVDEQIITALGPTAAKTFGQEIVALLHNNKGWG